MPVSRVFISYAHEDEKWKKRIEAFLTPFAASNSVSFWSDKKILPSEDFEDRIRAEIDECDLALLLVSPSFLSSNFIMDVELPLLEMEKKPLFWIPISACVYNYSPLARIEAALPPDEPLDTLSDPIVNKKLVEVDSQMRKVLGHVHDEVDDAVEPDIDPLKSKRRELEGFVDRMTSYLYATAQTIQDPVYFLDENFCIEYFNNAAKLIFGLREETSLEKPIGEVMAEKQARIKDIDKVQEHFLQTFGRNPEKAPPYDFEKIVYITDAYGEATLRKISRIVKSATGKNLWVVTYNIVGLDEWSTYIARLEGMVVAGSTTSVPGTAKRTLAFKPYGGYGYELQTDPQGIDVCQKVAYQVMLSSAYKLKGRFLQKYREEYEKTPNASYILACDASGNHRGASRMVLDYNLKQFTSTLDEDFLESISGGIRVAEAEIYIEKPGKENQDLFEGLFAADIRFLRANEVDAVYIQMSEDHVETFKTFGFRVVGKPFVHRHWYGTWWPMALRIRYILNHFQEPDFPKIWKGKFGADLDIAFWRRIADLIAAA